MDTQCVYYGPKKGYMKEYAKIKCHECPWLDACLEDDGNVYRASKQTKEERNDSKRNQRDIGKTPALD